MNHFDYYGFKKSHKVLNGGSYGIYVDNKENRRLGRVGEPYKPRKKSPVKSTKKVLHNKMSVSSLKSKYSSIVKELSELKSDLQVCNISYSEGVKLNKVELQRRYDICKKYNPNIPFNRNKFTKNQLLGTVNNPVSGILYPIIDVIKRTIKLRNQSLKRVELALQHNIIPTKEKVVKQTEITKVSKKKSTEHQTRTFKVSISLLSTNANRWFEYSTAPPRYIPPSYVISWHNKNVTKEILKLISLPNYEIQSIRLKYIEPLSGQLLDDTTKKEHKIWSDQHKIELEFKKEEQRRLKWDEQNGAELSIIYNTTEIIDPSPKSLKSKKSFDIEKDRRVEWNKKYIPMRESNVEKLRNMVPQSRSIWTNRGLSSIPYYEISYDVKMGSNISDLNIKDIEDKLSIIQELMENPRIGITGDIPNIEYKGKEYYHTGSVITYSNGNQPTPYTLKKRPGAASHKKKSTPSKSPSPKPKVIKKKSTSQIAPSIKHKHIIKSVTFTLDITLTKDFESWQKPQE